MKHKKSEAATRWMKRFIRESVRTQLDTGAALTTVEEISNNAMGDAESRLPPEVVRRGRDGMAREYLTEMFTLLQRREPALYERFARAMASGTCTARLKAEVFGVGKALYSANPPAGENDEGCA
jgi:hypothetical protein